MLGHALEWKYPTAEFVFREDTVTLVDVLCQFPIDVEGINYTEQSIPCLCGKGEKQEYTRGLLPSLEDQKKWVEEYREYGLPMAEWKRKMRKSDSFMSRVREHTITKIDNGVADNEEEQKRYDAKVALRSEKPSQIG